MKEECIQHRAKNDCVSPVRGGCPVRSRTFCILCPAIRVTKILSMWISQVENKWNDTHIYSSGDSRGRSSHNPIRDDTRRCSLLAILILFCFFFVSLFNSICCSFVCRCMSHPCYLHKIAINYGQRLLLPWHNTTYIHACYVHIRRIWSYGLSAHSAQMHTHTTRIPQSQRAHNTEIPERLCP